MPSLAKLDHPLDEALGKTMNERIDVFLKDMLEIRRRLIDAICDGIRSYVAVYENLVRDPEQDKRAAA